MRPLAALLALVLAGGAAAAAEPRAGAGGGPLQDDAGVLSARSRAELEQQLRAEAAAGRRVGLLVLRTAGTAPLDATAWETYQRWGLGEDGDAGLLVVFAARERQARLWVGPGLAGALPEELARQAEAAIGKMLARGPLEAGIVNGTVAVLAALHAREAEAQAGGEAGQEAEAGADAEPPLPEPPWGEGAGAWIRFLRAVNARYAIDDSEFRWGFGSVAIGILLIFELTGMARGVWVLYFFLIPFWIGFGIPSFGPVGAAVACLLHLVLFPVGRLFFLLRARGRREGTAAGGRRYAGVSRPGGDSAERIGAELSGTRPPARPEGHHAPPRSPQPSEAHRGQRPPGPPGPNQPGPPDLSAFRPDLSRFRRKPN